MQNFKRLILFLCFCNTVKADDFKLVNINFEDHVNKSAAIESEINKLKPPKVEVIANSIVLRASQIEREIPEFKSLGKYIYRIESDDVNKNLFFEQQNIKENSLRLVRFGKTERYAVTDGSIIISYIESQLIFELVNELNLEVISHLPRINVITVKTSDFNGINELVETLQNNVNVKQAYIDIYRQELKPR